ncbi:MAG: glycosyltransferase [Lachnospiraceae bacterium]|nr:glycosyltransferase [Lachnospiraceae bacterium]
MKVLLVGEFSKLHNNLQYGLKQLGVNVDTINTGDGFKKFNSDIKQLEISQDKKWDFIRKCYSDLLYTYIHNKYDVIQFIHELELGEKYGLRRELGISLAKNARLSVLLLAGCNWQYFRYAKEKLGISPCEECLKYDVKRKYGCPLAHDSRARKTAYAFQKNVDVMVPMLHEYDVCSKYGPFADKVVEPINIPIKFADTYPLSNHKGSEKLLIYHPLNREGFKGTIMIRKAFKILSKRYADVADFIIEGKMPYEEYSKLMEKVDIVVDEKNGTSFGVTGLEAMAKGKILITGNYRENIQFPRYEHLKSAPAFELGTTVDEIVENIANVIDRRNEFEKIAASGREYVKQYHDCKKVAQQFLDLYEQRLK